MRTLRAADVVKRRLSLASRRLGAHDPVPALGGMLDRSFDLPLGDPRYGNNALIPGCLPLEHSFAETSPRALRFDCEPLGRSASPVARVHEASQTARKLIHTYQGPAALRWFDHATEPFRGSTVRGQARFGAWFGAAFDENGAQEVKVYYEVGSDPLQGLPPNLQHAGRVAMACLPGLVPIFTSVSAGRTQGSQRIYFFHRGDLRLLDLEPLMHQLGIGHQLPSVLTAAGLILGGRFVLPEGSVILGLRDTTRGLELKLDVLLPGVPDPPRQMHGLIRMHLAQRPESYRALEQWFRAMTPDDCQSPGEISVVSLRVNRTAGARLTLYFRPVGYEESERTRERRPNDPYAVHV